MKTAMQELIGYIEKGHASGINGILSTATNLLEKEKKQISDAHDDALENPDSYGGVTYFNEKYRQS